MARPAGFDRQPPQRFGPAERSGPQGPRVQDVHRNVAAIGRLERGFEAWVVRAPRHSHRRPLTDEQHGFAALAQAAEMRGDGLERRQRHGGAQLEHVPLRQLRFLHGAPHREQLAAAPFERADPLEQVGLVAREAQSVERRQRVHDDHQVGGLQLIDEALERLPQRDGDRRVLVDVVVVQEDREEPHVFLRRFDRRLRWTANLQRLAVVHPALAVQPHELRGLHGLRHLVFGDDEVGGLQIGHRLVVSIDDRNVDPDEIHCGSEDRLSGLCRRLRRFLRLLTGGLLRRRCGRLLRLLGRRLLWRLPRGSTGGDDERGCQDDGQHAAGA